MEAGAFLQFEQVTKVYNCNQKRSGHVFRAHFPSKSGRLVGHKCINFGWVQRFSLLLTLCARRPEQRAHQAELVGKDLDFREKYISDLSGFW